MKINLLVLFLFTSLFLNAQIKKGALFIGGDVSFSAAKYKSTDPVNPNTSQNSAFNFSPSLGWVVKDNFIIGGKLSASFYNNKQTPNIAETNGNSFGAGIWMRKYLPLGKSFYLFTDASFNGYSVYRKQTQAQLPDYYYKENGFGLNAAIIPGVAYQIKKSLFLEASLNNLVSIGYARINTEQRNQGGIYGKGINNSFNISSSLSNGVPLQIGVRWIIAK